MFLSIQSMVLLAPKLNDSVKNGELLKYLAKCQMDEQVYIDPLCLSLRSRSHVSSLESGPTPPSVSAE